MALPRLERLEFEATAAPFASWAADTIEWVQLLARYRWHGDWHRGLAARRKHSRAIRQAAARQGQIAAIDAIMEWGGMRSMSAQLMDRVIASLPVLDELAVRGATPSQELCAERIASVSKVYAAYDMRSWVIYDSRVAWALACAVRGWEEVSAERTGALQFPQPQGRSGAGFEGFPGLHGEEQARRGFVYASWLCQAIAKDIGSRCPDPGGWHTAHVEMALFSLGDPKTRKEVSVATAGRRQTSNESNKPALSASGLALAAGRQMIQSELVRQTAQQHVIGRVEKLVAKGQAMRFAEQTGGEAALVQFPDGPERWTIFKDGEPLLTFPVYEGDLENALRFHDLARLTMKQPRELATEIERERRERRERLRRPWGKQTSTGTDATETDLDELGEARDASDGS